MRDEGERSTENRERKKELQRIGEGKEYEDILGELGNTEDRKRGKDYKGLEVEKGILRNQDRKRRN